MTTARKLYELGYRDLVSITPVNARLLPSSNIKPQMRGKAPGRFYGNGWGGYDWRHALPVTEVDIEAWPAEAGVGIRTDRFPAVDIDCHNVKLSEFIATRAKELLGPAPVRIGQLPKQLLAYRTDEPFGRMRLWIGQDLVEILGDGQQYVAGGIHPATKEPYSWPLGLVAAETLTPITPESAKAFLDALADDLEMMGYEVRFEGTGAKSADRSAIDQAGLRGDERRIAEVMGLLPNDNEHFSGRDDYLRVGYALKGALGDEGLKYFMDWALKWEGNDRVSGNTPEEIESDWKRMKPPFEVGAPYLYELGREFGYNEAADEFQASEVTPDEASVLDAGPGGPIQFSDAAVADALVKKHGQELRFCPSRGKWLAWDGVKWNTDSTKRVIYLAGQICRKLSNRALTEISNPVKAESVATRLASTGAKRAAADYCADNPKMQIGIEKLDANPYLLNTPGGMVDLRTGDLQPHDPSEFATRCTAVAPKAGATPLWTAFLEEATGADLALQRYLQRLVGYALTGLKTEHNLAFIYGSGGNGKGVFLNTMTAIFGDYSEAASMDTFTTSRYDRHPTELAGLAGARLVTAQETQEGRHWDEQKVKMLTSADPVRARFMREDFFTFDPKFKLVFAGNHKPEIRNLDDAMRRRFHLVPFTQKPRQVDPMLQEKLKAEWPQILAWAIEGAQLWMMEGLNPPPSVLEATAEYFDEEDPMGQWIDDRLEVGGSKDFVSLAALYDNWREWCGENGEQAKSKKAFARALRERGGFRATRTNEARGFEGLCLRDGPGSEFLP